MAWIESHQSLGTHRKTKRLARELHIGIPQAIGHLHLVWWWCLDNAPDGNLQRIDHKDLADAGLWRKSAEAFFEALIVAEFIDSETCTLHNWYDYAGKLVDKRDLTREQRQAGGRSRMGQLTPEERSTLARQAARSRWSTSENASSDAKSPGIPMPATVPTVPNHTNKENITKEKNTQPQKITGADKPVFVLPDWIKKENWSAFTEMRKKLRAPLTDRAAQLVISELEKLRSAGNDPNEVLNQSTMNSYKGVFALKGGNGAKNRGNPRQLPARDSYTRPEELRTGTG